MKKIVILISGRGSNMQAILEARLPAQVAAVISNDPRAGGLATAQQHGVATRVVDHRPHRDRAAFDSALSAEIDALAPDLVVLAGFMRILTDAFVNHYRGRLIKFIRRCCPHLPVCIRTGARSKPASGCTAARCIS